MADGTTDTIVSTETHDIPVHPKKKEAPKKALYEQKDIVKDLFASKCNEKQQSVFNEKEDFM